MCILHVAIDNHEACRAYHRYGENNDIHSNQLEQVGIADLLFFNEELVRLLTSLTVDLLAAGHQSRYTVLVNGFRAETRLDKLSGDFEVLLVCLSFDHILFQIKQEWGERALRQSFDLLIVFVEEYRDRSLT